MSQSTYVIVGASLAGAKAAEAVREEGFDGRVVLVGDELERPYERPPLSKEYLRGEAERGKVFVHDEGFYAEHDIELLLGRRATALDPGAHTLTLDAGETLAYDRLLLTTGAEPRRLPLPGADLDGMLLLRSLADCETLRERLAGGGRLVVVGAGWIGCEVAASARQSGMEVTVLEPLSVPLERVLGPEVGAIYAGLHRSHGVDLRCGDGVAAFEGSGRVERVVTSSGERIACDAVVVGVGVVPRVDLAAAAGLEVGNGVLVDAGLRTSAPDVYAAGDVAAAEHPLYGTRVRVEHWANALNQGAAAGRSMAGADVAYDRVPYFFSDQYDLGMEYRGHAPDGWDEVRFRGDPESGSFIAFWLRDGVVQAAMNANEWDSGDDLAALVGARTPVDAGALVDTGTPLASVYAA